MPSGDSAPAPYNRYTDVPSMVAQWYGGAGEDVATGPDPDELTSWTDTEGSRRVDGLAFNLPQLTTFSGLRAWSTDGIERMQAPAPDAGLSFLHDGSGMTILADVNIVSLAGKSGVIDTCGWSGSARGAAIRWMDNSGAEGWRLNINNGSTIIVDFRDNSNATGRYRIAARYRAAGIPGHGSDIADIWTNGTRSASTASSSGSPSSGSPGNALAISGRSGSSLGNLLGSVHQIVLCDAAIADADITEWMSA